MRKEDIIKQLCHSKRDLAKFFYKVSSVVQDSFRNDLIIKPVYTQHEIKRRTNICYDWFIRLRLDLGYSSERAMDTLSKALRSTLDGDDWTPPPPERAWMGEE